MYRILYLSKVTRITTLCDYSYHILLIISIVRFILAFKIYSVKHLKFKLLRTALRNVK